MSSRFERFVIALAFAILAAGVTLLIAGAQDGESPVAQFTQDCAACHTDFQTNWQSGPHGQAGSDPIFLDEWTKQGIWIHGVGVGDWPPHVLAVRVAARFRMAGAIAAGPADYFPARPGLVCWNGRIRGD